MSHTLRLLLTLVLTLLLAACGQTGDPSLAASVNGVDIPISDVEERIESLRANEQFAQQLANDPDGSVLAGAQAEVLNSLVQTVLLEQGAREEFGIEIGQAEVDEQRAAIVEQVGGEEAFTSLVEQNGLTPEQVDFELRRAALGQAVNTAVADGVEVSDEQVQAFYDENRETRFGPSASARHILVEDEATAQQVLDRLAGGEDFAAVAGELSTDPGSAAQGGDLGELAPGQTVAAFDDAVFNSPVGEVVGPIQTEFGFHVLEVTERNDEGRPLADVEGEIRDELAQGASQEGFNTFLRERAEAAEVTVNPRFGVWNPETAAVEPENPLGEVSTPAASP